MFVRTGWRVLLPLVIAGVLASATPAAASGWSPTWTREFGRSMASVATDASGNVYVTGADGRFMKLRSYTPNGVLRWARSWTPGPRRATASGVDIAVRSDGDLYVVGNVNNGQVEGVTSWFLREYGPGGALRWHNSHRDSGGVSGVTVSGDSVVVSGNFSGCCDEAYRDGWVQGYTLGGTLRWTNRFEDPSVPSKYDDMAEALAPGPEGSVFVAGWTARGVEGSWSDPAPHDVMVQRISETGHRQWSRVMVRPDAVPKHLDEASGVDVRGKVLAVAAHVNQVRGAPRFQPGHPALWRISFHGDREWFRQWDVQPGWKGWTAGVAVGPNGAVYVSGRQLRAGHDGSHAFLRKYAADGTFRRMAVIAGPKVDSEMGATHVVVRTASAYLVGDNGWRYGCLWRFPA